MATPAKGKFRLTAIRELSSVALTVFIVVLLMFEPFRGQTFEEGLWAIFWPMMIFGGYTWIQDLGAATDEDLRPVPALLEGLASLLPVLVIGYALLQHMIGETTLSLPNLLILIGGLLFTLKDFVIGLLLIYRLLFLSDDFRGRIDTPNS